MVMIQKVVNVNVDEQDYILNYGDEPYGDGRPIEEAIEVDVEQTLLDMVPGTFPFECEVEIG